jgi:prepilin-type N-terminal cleavage/methylation domain-containing protein
MKHRNEAGFTLLETSIAMVILAVAGLGVASCFFFAAKNNNSARERELAMAVAQQQLEQLRNVAFGDASLTASDTNSTVTRANRPYLVRTTITDGNFQAGTARSKTIQIRVTPWADQSAWARNVATVFGSVTVISERTSQGLGPNRTF